MNALGNPEGDGPGGIFVIDHETFEIKGAWEAERGPQNLAYDFWWHINHDTMITSEWGTPKMVENGVVPELLLGGEYGHQLHVWDLRTRNHKQAIELGPENQMALELRPAHDPRKAYGFVGVVTNTANLAGRIYLWHEDGNGGWTATKVIEVDAEPADPNDLPPLAARLRRGSSGHHRHQPVARR